MQEFGKQEYRQMAYINFERADELRNTFLPDLNPKRLITEFELYSNLQIMPEDIAQAIVDERSDSSFIVHRSSFIVHRSSFIVHIHAGMSEKLLNFVKSYNCSIN
jgi:superfamily II helicase